MPPPPSQTKFPLFSNITTSSFDFKSVSQFCLLVLVVAACIRLAVLRSTQRKNIAREPHQYLKEKENRPCQESTEKESPSPEPGDLNGHDTSTYKCVYPWITPPYPLAGPYDYPPPSLRRYSSVDPSSTTSAETNTINYTRRVSTNSIPVRQSTIHGAVTTSQDGWRRNLWTVSGG